MTTEGKTTAMDPLTPLAFWLGFSKSTIKSGEPWSETCEQMHEEARNAFAAIIAREQITERLKSREEAAELQLIDERDRAEEAMSQAYFLITGRSPEWSNPFGFDQALEDVDDAQSTIRQAKAKLLARVGELEVALGIIARASERSETMFGGKMSDVTRVFESITCVARLTPAAEAKDGEAGA